MNSRFMVDMITYNEMHPRDYDPPRARQNRDTIDVSVMEEDYPDLGDDFSMCLPTTIKGFNMQKHEWGNETQLLWFPLTLTTLLMRE